jgi:hypothetical protein
MLVLLIRVQEDFRDEGIQPVKDQKTSGLSHAVLSATCVRKERAASDAKICA